MPIMNHSSSTSTWHTGKPLTVFDVSSLSQLTEEAPRIRTGAHCFGCTAGRGSS